MSSVMPPSNPQPVQITAPPVQAQPSLQQQIRQVQATPQGQSFLDRIKAKMNGKNGLGAQMWRQAPKQRSRHTIRSNRWDEMVWTEARKTQDIDNLITDLSLGDEHKGGERKPFDMAPELVHDIFLALYKAAPHLLLKREIIKQAIPVRKIMEEILESPKLEELQEMTATDAVMSTIAVTAMADVIREILTRIPPPPPPGGTCGGNCGGQAGPNGEKGTGTCTCTPATDGGGGEGEEDEDEDLTDEEGRILDLERAREEAEKEAAERDWEAEMEGLLDDTDIDRLVNKALDEADKEVDDLDNLRKGIGLEDGEWRSMDPSQRIAMAQRLNSPNMKALADIIGKMKRFALGIKATRIVDVPHEAFDVEPGNEIRRLLKAQFALLGNPVTKYEFFRRYADRELMQYKMRGREEIGKGPILMGIDKSGSMHGEPFNWAMAVAEALRRFAADEDRDFFAAFFGSNHDRERFEFPKGKAPFEKVLAFLSCEANGGTQFDGILEELLGRATKEYDAEGTTKSDIVFITDGMAHLDEDWIKKFNEEKERIGVRVYSVFVGGAYDMGGRGGPVGLLNSFSDGVINVKELTPEAVEQIFQKV